MADETHGAFVAPGTFVAHVAGRREVVYVAGPPGHRWAFWNGQVFQSTSVSPSVKPVESRGHFAQQLTAPMPATVVKVLAAPGAQVKKGETVVILEAMKMELPVRSLADGTITAVHCREGELVQADQVLVDLE